MPKLLADLSIEELRALPKEKTVVLFPVGGIEEQSTHLPVGVDFKIAERWCLEFSNWIELRLPGWVVLVAPSVPFTLSGDTAGFSLAVRPHVLRDWLVDSAFALWKEGFKQFAAFSPGLTPKDLTAIEEVNRLLRWRANHRFRPGGRFFLHSRPRSPTGMR